MRETPLRRAGSFDFFGFAALSIAIGALQLMLDRGESQDWFGSQEIVLEAAVAGLAFYAFLVHMFTASRPFIEPGLFKDRNFAAGLLLILLVGVMLLATMALLPPFLQSLLGFPVLTTGYVLAPRGGGTMFAMLIVGRLVGKVDTRWLIGFGLGMIALSLWQMTGFDLDTGVRQIIGTGVVQGIGLGFVFVPLSAITFATLAPHYRSEGTAMFSLMRNIGSSVGISLVVTVLGQQAQANHAVLAEVLTPFRSVLRTPWLPPFWDWTSPGGLQALNAEVTRQALMNAYLSDFRLMMYMTLCASPLLLLLRGGVARRSA